MSLHLRAVLLAAIGLFGAAPPVAAQTWTPEQRSALAVVEQSWVDDLAEDATWVDRLTHPEMLSWGTNTPMPRDQATAKRWSEYTDENSNALIHTIAPVGIAIRGDAAVVHYYATVASEDREGKRSTTISRCTDTLTRAGNSWRYLGWFCFDEPNTERTLGAPGQLLGAPFRIQASRIVVLPAVVFVLCGPQVLNESAG